MTARQIKTIFFRIVALGLLLALVAIGIFGYRSLNRLPNQIVYFIKSEGSHFSLQAVARNSESGSQKDKLIDALGFLILGPKASEKTKGLSTAFNRDTKILHLSINGDEVSVDFSNEFLYSTSKPQGLLNQVFYTLSQPKAIKSIRLLVDGSPLDYIGGAGIVVAQPWSKTSNDLPTW